MVGFVFGWWDIAELGVKSPVVEPLDVAECRCLDVFGVTPWPLAFDELSLVEPVEALSESVIVRIADGPDRGACADFSEAFGVAN